MARKDAGQFGAWYAVHETKGDMQLGRYARELVASSRCALEMPTERHTILLLEQSYDICPAA